MLHDAEPSAQRMPHCMSGSEMHCWWCFFPEERAAEVWHEPSCRQVNVARQGDVAAYHAILNGSFRAKYLLCILTLAYFAS